MANIDSSSSTSHQCQYDVFISFRGSDTRNGFTSHLQAALGRKKIATFVDNELDRGEEISPSLLKIIEASKIAVIIFSRNYASSQWCLDELVHIMVCRQENGQIVLPVFHNVDPSNIENQSGDFGEAFDRLKEEFRNNESKVERWIGALTEAAKLAGWDSSVTRPESVLIDEVTGDVLKKLNRMASCHPTNLVGVDSRIQEIESLLRLELPEVRRLGIWGMGGIGKTAIAQAIFDRLYSQFEEAHFLSNVKEQLKTHTAVSLRNKLLSEILHDDCQRVGTPHAELPITKLRLQRTKVLIVLDDVDDSIQLQELLCGREFFGHGSRILITSRDKQVLRNVEADEIYTVEGLNDDAALQLFCLHAFKSNHPTTDLMKLSDRAVNYAKGNPLALIVSGSALYNRTKEEWDSALSKVEKYPDPKILDMLKVSYDELDDEEKRIFLDIACFFRGKCLDYVSKLVNSYGSSAHFTVTSLIDKSLLTVCQNKLEIHDLLQEMGRSIVRAESLLDPGKRSRLWNTYEVSDVLAGNKGTEAIQGIFLDVAKIEKLRLRSDVFAMMSNLRFLIFNGNCCERKVILPHGLKSLPTELRYLHWVRFPLKSLPSTFCPQNLVNITLPHSKLKLLWTGIQCLENLMWIDLSHSTHLRRIPDLSKAKNVVSINLEGCKSLVSLHSSVGYLSKLEYLILKDCERLKRVPTKIDSKFLKVLNLSNCSRLKVLPEISAGKLEELDLCGSAIKQVPESMYHRVESLSKLCLSGISNVFEFPDPEYSWNVRYLHLRDTGIRRVPASIQCLKSLVVLNLRCCLNLSSLPSGICELRCLEALELSHCSNLEVLPANINQLPQLLMIGLSHCKRLGHLPEPPPSLETLVADRCSSLENLSWSGHLGNLKKVDFSYCNKMDCQAPSSIMKAAQCTIQHIRIKAPRDRDEVTIIYPGWEIPKWISDKTWGCSLTISLPSNTQRCFNGVVLWVVFEVADPPWPTALLPRGYFSLDISCKYRIRAEDDSKRCEGTVYLYSGKTSFYMRDHVLISYQPRLDRLKEGWLSTFAGGKATFKFYTQVGIEDSKFCEVTKCGVHFLWDDEEKLVKQEPLGANNEAFQP